MTNPENSPPGGLSPRIGSAERQQAMDALDVHLSAGRLDPDEYGERVGRASVARTVADLEPLFVDLPAPHATGSVAPPKWTPPSGSPAPDGRARDVRRSGGKHHGREPLGGRAGEVVVAASPFVALILFFSTVSFFGNAWLFFLLIPLAGAVVYGRGNDDK